MDEKNKIYYKHIPTGDIYRIQAVGYDMETKSKRLIMRNLSDGKDWDLAWKDLFDVKAIDTNKITNIWERQPDGWYPIKNKNERPYQGYTDDPRENKGGVRDGYNAYGQRISYSSRSSNNFGSRR